MLSHPQHHFASHPDLLPDHSVPIDQLSSFHWGGLPDVRQGPGHSFLPPIYHQHVVARTTSATPITSTPHHSHHSHPPHSPHHHHHQPPSSPPSPISSLPPPPPPSSLPTPIVRSQTRPKRHRQQQSCGSKAPRTRINGTGRPVRRRISRACDQCNQLRTKCDGRRPCVHCTKYSLGCQYAREHKKRGKVSKKELEAQAAEAAAAVTPTPTIEAATATTTATTTATATANDPNSLDGNTSVNDGKPCFENDECPNPPGNGTTIVDYDCDTASRRSSATSLGHHAQLTPVYPDHHSDPSDPNGSTEMMNDTTSLVDVSVGADLGGFGNRHVVFGPSDMSAQNGCVSTTTTNTTTMVTATTTTTATGIATTSGQPYGLDCAGISSFSAPICPLQASSPFQMPPTTPLGAFLLLEAPATSSSPNANSSVSSTQPRYPVLDPLLPHLDGIMSVSLACDLLNYYFDSSSWALSPASPSSFLSRQPASFSPYVLCSVFRKRSLLRPTNPRRCRPALLASMLWVAAQTSDAALLVDSPSARAGVCQKLLDLTVGLLKPLVHSPAGDISPVASPVTGHAALGVPAATTQTIPMPTDSGGSVTVGEAGVFGTAGGLDDVVTYVHLATVVSASEHKRASLRWWNAAWSLARELKLGRELPAGTYNSTTDSSDVKCVAASGAKPTAAAMSEEEREERRRIWWLLYMVDRHLALCYNQPLHLLDAECQGLLRPMDEMAWREGDDDVFRSARSAGPGRAQQYECTGHDVFGFFLPLMTILGEVADLHLARNHPRFGVGFRPAHDWDCQAAEIARHLDTYGRSLSRFGRRGHGFSRELSGTTKTTTGLDDANVKNDDVDMNINMLDTNTNANANVNAHANGNANANASVHANSNMNINAVNLGTRIVLAYGTHVMHVLHILLEGKWDPIGLLDDDDMWISSRGFVTATGHAVEAAAALDVVLACDPTLGFMPFFFGIYLLQGSFLPLLLTDKLRLGAPADVMGACETIVRAHDACAATLDTEYQRNFSRVMRSALAQARGRVPDDLGGPYQTRRELLSLYRWTSDGTGLAV